jgi:hypothetical protein
MIGLGAAMDSVFRDLRDLRDLIAALDVALQARGRAPSDLRDRVQRLDALVRDVMARMPPDDDGSQGGQHGA